MLIKRNKYIQDEDELQMTPMIDIVFQLLIFFLLSAKFIALEGHLGSYLPKDKGLNTDVVPIDDANVTLDLVWVDEGDGKVACRTMNYREPGSDEVKPVHAFGQVPGVDLPYGPPDNRRLVQIGYSVPDFDKIEAYLKHRKESHEELSGKELPVVVNFDDKVKLQVVMTLLDICHRLEIKEFTLMAREME